MPEKRIPSKKTRHRHNIYLQLTRFAVDLPGLFRLRWKNTKRYGNKTADGPSS